MPAPATLCNMFDFIMCRATVPPDRVLSGGPIIFTTDSQVDRETGQELTRRGDLGPFAVSYSLSDHRLELRGSIHKYHTGGHNHTDFTRTDVLRAVARLSDDLRTPADCIDLHALEIGVNVCPPCPTSDVIARLGMLQVGQLRPFAPINGLPPYIGKDTRRGKGRYHVKFYNKAQQDGLLLRVELHAQVSYLRERLGVAVGTLADLTKPEIWNGCADLFRRAALEGVVWHEPLIGGLDPADAEFYHRAGRWEYWQGVKGSTRSRRLRRYQQLGQQHRTDTYTTDLLRIAKVKLAELTSAHRPAVTAPAAPIPFATALASQLPLLRALTPTQQARLAAGQCVVCGRPLPPDHRTGAQTCPRSIRQCRNIKSNRYHDQLRPLRREHALAAAGQVRLFPLTTGLQLEPLRAAGR